MDQDDWWLSHVYLTITGNVRSVRRLFHGSTSHTTFCRTRIVVYVSIVVITARNLPTKSLLVLEGKESMCSFKCPYVGKQSELDTVTEVMHTVFHAQATSRFFAFIHCQRNSSRCAGVLSCLKYLCLRVGGRSSRIPIKNSNIIKISLCS